MLELPTLKKIVSSSVSDFAAIDTLLNLWGLQAEDLSHKTVTSSGKRSNEDTVRLVSSRSPLSLIYFTKTFQVALLQVTSTRSGKRNYCQFLLQALNR